MADLPHSVGIKALGRTELERLVSELGQPAYRVRQIETWLYARGVSSWEGMTDLPSSLRSRLAEEHPLETPRLLERQESRIDGTRKYLWALADGNSVESVGIPTEDRLTVCFSTQAGCAMGCRFCATGRSGFIRDLGPGEMVDQVRLVGIDFGRRVSNAVAMGQGEPFANYDHTLSGLRFMNSPEGLAIGARHLTVSTCGLLAGIDRFAEEPEQFTLAVSLHSAVQDTRDSLMPGVRGIPLAELRRSIERYIQISGRRVTLEYALIEGVNDGSAEIEALAAFCRGLLCHVNLIPVNPVAGASLAASDRTAVASIERALDAMGVETTVRTERGADIDAACGQLKQLHEES